MAAGVTIKHKRKAGAFVGTELAAGEFGVDVSNNDVYTSVNGTTVFKVNGAAGSVDTANSPNANEFARFTDADTIEGRTVSETKADLSLDNVTNESKATMFTSPTFTGTPVAPTPTAADSSTKIATTAFVAGEIATAVTGLLEFKGSTDCSANPNYPAASKGDAYVVSVAGKIGGASGKSVDVADVYFATADNAGGNEATVGTSWTVLEHNLVGAYVAGGTDVPVADGGTGSSTAAGAATNLGLGTGDSPQFTAVNVGHASDTTITRSGAGDIAVEGNALYRAGGTDVPIGDGGTGSSTAGAARTALGTDVASNITSGDMAAARMQVNLKAALEAVSQTFNSTNTTIDGGTI